MHTFTGVKCPRLIATTHIRCNFKMNTLAILLKAMTKSSSLYKFSTHRFFYYKHKTFGWPFRFYCEQKKNIWAQGFLFTLQRNACHRWGIKEVSFKWINNKYMMLHFQVVDGFTCIQTTHNIIFHSVGKWHCGIEHATHRHHKLSWESRFSLQCLSRRSVLPYTIGHLNYNRKKKYSTNKPLLTT